MIHFTKISALGNDFIALDNRNGRFDQLPPQFIQHICHRRKGVGADGVLLLCPADPPAAYRMRIFNSDGSEAPMCGNGSRALAFFARELGIIAQEGIFLAGDGLHRVFLETTRIGLELHPPVEIHRLDAQLRSDPVITALPAQCRHLGFVNTGVPHYLVYCENPELLDLSVWGPRLAHHPLFAPGGTNVNFVTRLADNHLSMRTYEKGVEGETLSCGTGAAAAVVLLNEERELRPPIRVDQPGGPLDVDFSGDFTRFTFSGAITPVCSGKWLQEYATGDSHQG